MCETYLRHTRVIDEDGKRERASALRWEKLEAAKCTHTESGTRELSSRELPRDTYTHRRNPIDSSKYRYPSPRLTPRRPTFRDFARNRRVFSVREFFKSAISRAILTPSSRFFTFHSSSRSRDIACTILLRYRASMMKSQREEGGMRGGGEGIGFAVCSFALMCLQWLLRFAALRRGGVRIRVTYSRGNWRNWWIMVPRHAGYFGGDVSVREQTTNYTTSGIVAAVARVHSRDYVPVPMCNNPCTDFVVSLHSLSHNGKTNSLALL